MTAYREEFLQVKYEDAFILKFINILHFINVLVNTDMLDNTDMPDDTNTSDNIGMFDTADIPNIKDKIDTKKIIDIVIDNCVTFVHFELKQGMTIQIYTTQTLIMVM